MKSCILFVLILGVINRISGLQCSTKFHMESTCVTPYGTSMTDVWPRSRIDCAINCVTTPFCQSFFYFHGTQLCRRNTEKLTSFSQACSDPQTYAEIDMNSTICDSVGNHPTTTTTTTMPTTTSATTTTGSGLPDEWQYMFYPYFFMSDPCTSNLECGHIMSSECRDGLCQCLSGYSFDWASSSCVDSCNNYGHSYQIEYDTILVGFNVGDFHNMSEEQCLQKCTDAGVFTCKSAVYDISTMTCHVSNETALTQPASVQTNALHNLYHRDCLFV